MMLIRHDASLHLTAGHIASCLGLDVTVAGRTRPEAALETAKKLMPRYALRPTTNLPTI